MIAGIIEGALNLLIIVFLAATAVVPLFVLKSDSDATRRIVSWIWGGFALAPLSSTFIHQLFESSPGYDYTGAIVFATIAIPILIPAVFLHRRPGRSLSFIFTYAWIGIGIFGIVFLLAMIGTPVIFIKVVVGRAPLEVFLTAIFMMIWTGSALFICASTIKTLKKIKLDLEKDKPTPNARIQGTRTPRKRVSRKSRNRTEPPDGEKLK